MEIFIRNIPEHVTEKHLNKAFKRVMEEVGIERHQYHCVKFRGPCGTLTLLDAVKGRELLEVYSDQGPRGGSTHIPQNIFIAPRRTVQSMQLGLFGKDIYLSVSRKPPDELLLRSLVDEERRRQQRGPNVPIQGAGAEELQRSFRCHSFMCGSWSYDKSDPIFIKHYHELRPVVVMFGRSFLRVSLKGYPLSHEVQFDYAGMAGPIYIGDHSLPTLTVTMDVAPRLFIAEEARNELINAFQVLGLRPRTVKPSKHRTGRLGPDDPVVFASCFTYRFALQDPADLQPIRVLKRERQIPKLISWAISSREPSQPYHTQVATFLAYLDRQTSLPYPIKYQLQMLVWNGSLVPTKVVGLFPDVAVLLARVGLEQTVQAIRTLARRLAFPGPEVDSSELDATNLREILFEVAESVGEGGRSILNRVTPPRPGRAWIHKATITPVGIYLYGPYWEPLNRVLRRYSKYTDYFMRVEFSDETGDPITYDRNANLDQIFGVRFKEVLQKGFVVGGRHFEFLGFSHSSLRAQTCWYMAPFTPADDHPLNAISIIPKLGDFSEIRSPAKCAARIGQTFSETLTSIKIPENIVELAQDVERNGRIFSDGVGTISASVMRMIWQEYAVRAKLKPTVFQVRFAGMIPVGSSLPNCSIDFV
jgi:RNA dependent RNA polymerase